MANIFAKKRMGGQRLPTPAKRLIGKAERQRERQATLMACLPFVGFLAFTFFPMLLSFVVCFTDLNSYDLSTMKFVGWDNLFKNFIYVFQDDQTGIAFVNSLKYTLTVPINLFICTLLAHLTSRELPGTKFMKTVLFIPSVCIGTAVTFMWQWILADNVGMINSAIIAAGGENVGFMSTEKWFMFSIMLISIWKSATNILMMQAGFANVSPQLKEAARIDGASEMQVFWRIILPGVTPQLSYCLIMNFISAMQEQSIMQIASAGGVGPNYSALTLSYQVYRLAFGAGGTTVGLGVGSALSWLIAAMIMIITKLLFKAQDRWVNYD